MALIPLSKDPLSTSTPIEEHGRTGSCKRYITSPVKGFDVLSPIKRVFPLRRNLFSDCRTKGSYDFSINIPNSKSQGLFEISFSFLEPAIINENGVDKFDDVSGVDKFDNDSGIECDKNLTTSKNRSNFDLTSFPTDENCNVISNCDKLNNNSCQISKCFDSIFENRNLECTKSESIFEILDNRTETTAITQQNPNLISNLDILSELNLRNCSAVLSHILSYLPDEDLRKASYVCKEWQDILFSDKEANERRKAYINKKRNITTGPEKENRYHSKHAAERSHKSVFLSVINSKTKESQQPLTFNEFGGRFDSFIKEVQSLLNDERLIKCPKCFYPSKAQSGNKYSCTRDLCLHIFCKKCMGPHFDNHRCSVPKLNATVPRVTIGSKQSKRNLRRL